MPARRAAAARGGGPVRRAAAAVAVCAAVACAVGGRPAALVLPGRAVCRRPLVARRAEGPAADGVDDLFGKIGAALAEHTALRKEMQLLVDEGREVARAGQGLREFSELLAWLQGRQAADHDVKLASLGPMAVSVVRHPKSGREVVILGTPHGVPGVSAEGNPVPQAVYRAILRMKPDVVAVELDKARGYREIENLPSSLFGKAPVMLPLEQDEAAAAELPAELRVDEGLMGQVKGSLGEGPASVEGMLRATREVWSSSSDASLAMNFLALTEHRYQGSGDWGRDATAAVRAAAKLGRPLLLCDFPQEWTLGKVYYTMLYYSI